MTVYHFRGIVSLCCLMCVGCAESRVIDKVANQAEEIATLKVALQTSEASLMSIKQDLEKTKSELATKEESYGLLKIAADGLQKSNDDLSVEIGALRDSLAKTEVDLASAKRELAHIESQRELQRRLLSAVGDWKSEGPAPQKSSFSTFTVREDGTAVYQRAKQGAKEFGYEGLPPAYALKVSVSEKPGVYVLEGRSEKGSALKGVLRVEHGGYAAALEGWDTADKPRAYFKDVSGLSELTPEMAQVLLKHPGKLVLNKVTTLSPEVASILAKYSGELELNGLGTLSVEVAKALAAGRQTLSLNGLTALSPEVAKALAYHPDTLKLNGLSMLSSDAAKSLARHRYELYLTGLATLSPEIASALAKHVGYMHLDGVKTISEEAAAQLQGQVGYKNLIGLSSLTDKARAILYEIPNIKMPERFVVEEQRRR